MPKITQRHDFQHALKTNVKQQRMLFEALQSDLAGLISRYSDSTGKIPPQKAQTLRDEAHTMILKYFVVLRKASPDEIRTEKEHLVGLIAIAQKQMRGATERQKNELRVRVTLLGKRLDILEKQGLVAHSIDAKGHGQTVYARALMQNVRDLLTQVAQGQATMVKGLLNARKTA
jgi:hypothetical protein